MHNIQRVSPPRAPLSISRNSLVRAHQIKASSPLYTAFSEGTGGAPQKGKTLTHAEVIRQATWPTIDAILKKEYVEV